MRVSTKGQATRKKLNFTSASEVQFNVGEDVRPRLEAIEREDLCGFRFPKLRRTVTVKMTAQEIMALMRAEM